VKFVWDPSFKKRFDKKTVEMQAAILEAIKGLEDFGTPAARPGLQIKKLQGYANTWSARVDQANRLMFEPAGDTITLVSHCNHSIVGP
jgi:Txe/YoeB family toxin of Txe-Axe toxin-antitoxin module